MKPRLKPLFFIFILISCYFSYTFAGQITEKYASLRDKMVHQGKGFLIELDIGETKKRQHDNKDTTMHEQFESCLSNHNVSYAKRQTYANTLFLGLSILLENEMDEDKLLSCSMVRQIWPLLKISKTKAIEFNQNYDTSHQKYFQNENNKFDRNKDDFTYANQEDTIDDNEDDQEIQNKIKDRNRHFHQQTGVSKLRTMGLTGKGVKVGILDTGIDYNHPAFQNRVKWGADFSQGLDKQTTDPLDECNGHGTHVAGIIGGNDKPNGFTGVAPEVEFGMYKIFGCSENTSATNDIFVSAMLKAYEDGMDIINLSLGNDGGFLDSPETQITDRLGKAGVIVNAANGNSGGRGLWQVNEPAVSQFATAVGSFNARYWVRRNLYLKYGLQVDIERAITYTFTMSPFKPPIEQSVNVIITNTEELFINDGCEPFDKNLLQLEDKSNSMLMVSVSGRCTLEQKWKNIELLQPAHVLLFGNSANTTLESLVSAVDIPSILIDEQDAEYIFRKAIENTMQSNDAELNLYNPTIAKIAIDITSEENWVEKPLALQGKISDFSNWGLGPDLQLKPDFCAPGQDLFSAYPLKKGGYSFQSGTSMAVPYITGAYALYLQYIKSKGSEQSEGMTTFVKEEDGLTLQDQSYNSSSPVDIRSIFQNYASPSLNYGDQNFAIHPIQQGSGFINVDRAILAESRVFPAKLSLGFVQESIIRNQKLTVINDSPNTKIFHVKTKSSLSITTLDAEHPKIIQQESMTAFVRFHKRFSREQVDHDTKEESSIYIEVQGKGKVSFEFNIYLPEQYAEGDRPIIFGGFIFVQESGHKVDTTMSIPFSGMYGDIHKLSVFDTKVHSPFLAFQSISQSMTIVPTSSYLESEKELDNVREKETGESDAYDDSLNREKKSKLSVNYFQIGKDNITIGYKLWMPVESITGELFNDQNEMMGSVFELKREGPPDPTADEYKNNNGSQSLVHYTAIDFSSYSMFEWDGSYIDPLSKQKLKIQEKGIYSLRLKIKRTKFINDPIDTPIIYYDLPQIEFLELGY